MKLYEMNEAIREAQATLANADEASDQMARLLVGRLSSVKSTWTLKALKKELSRFNAHTGEWRD